MDKERGSLEIAVKTKVSFDRISDLLTGAVEGGSSYWASFKRGAEPKNFNNTRPGDEIYGRISYPVNEGGSLLVIDSEEDTT